MKTLIFDAHEAVLTEWIQKDITEPIKVLCSDEVHGLPHIVMVKASTDIVFFFFGGFTKEINSP